MKLLFSAKDLSLIIGLYCVSETRRPVSSCVLKLFLTLFAYISANWIILSIDMSKAIYIHSPIFALSVRNLLPDG